MGNGEFNAGGHPAMEILLVFSCCRNQDKLQPNEPLCSDADLTLPT